MAMQRSAFVLIALLLATVVHGHVASSSWKLKQVQVIHRHGARTPVGGVNDSLVCGELGCGMLTVQGKEMLTNLGKYVRTTYGESLGLSNSYKPVKEVHSRSTDIPRTLQSSDSFLRGLFSASPADWYPVIHTKPLYDDDLLVVNALPAFTVNQAVNGANMYTTLAVQLSGTFTVDELFGYAEALNFGGFCAAMNSSAALFGECAVVVADTAIAYHSMGVLTQQCPACAANLDSFHFVFGLIGKNAYSYNPVDHPEQKEMGSFGQNLVNKVLGNAATASEKVLEYSGHDTTLMPFLATLGFNDNRSAYYQPYFGQAIIVEAYVSEENATDIAISVKYGHPEQAADSDHTYTFNELMLNCVDVATQSFYRSTSCPVKDVAAFASRSAPQSPEGYCFTTFADMKAINCTSLAAPYPPTIETGGVCAWYRTKCPLYGCPKGFYVYPKDNSCHPIGQ